MMEEHPDAPSAKRRRASRAGQAKRFQCKHPGCEKRYSRAEHLHRHELNHNPKQIYRCNVPDCGHTFVRLDLFTRHKARHDELGAVLPHEPSDSRTDTDDMAAERTPLTVVTSPASSAKAQIPPPSIMEQAPDPAESHGRMLSSSSAVEQVASFSSTWDMDARPPLLTPESSLAATSSLDLVAVPSFLTDNTSNPAQSASAQATDNFASWLFESPGSQFDDFELANMPFLDFGLEYSPKDMWNLEDFSLPTDHSTGGDSLATPKGSIDLKQSTWSISEQKLADVAALLSHFVRKQKSQHPLIIQDESSLLYSPDTLSFPNISAGMLDKFIASYWMHVGKEIPIVHQPTFSANSCNVHLLLAIVMLGAADLVKSKPRGHLTDYGDFADMIAVHLRWEIFTDSDAQPPIQLWVAQALLLLEFYEKQWSTRKLHERAHIHHASTLTLLRRGSPLVGRSESETPTSGNQTRCTTPGNGDDTGKPKSAFDSWWSHWVRSESFNRVVFKAFEMDTMHALMYGHAADMAPYEIRLPLPCDDSLWTAQSAEEVHRLDANLKMYGIQPINFLDGLRRCLHAHDVQTHAPARMLLMAGLLSVGWHISRREKHLQFLETVPSVREQGRWRSLLLDAFGHWRESFDEAVGTRRPQANVNKNNDSSGPTVLYHLAHMTMHADIIDNQIFAGSKRLLGRKVSDKDFRNVLHRMKSWACTPVARHAVLHAFKLLHEVLVSKPKAAASRPHLPAITYSCRHDSVFYRPWAVYIASLIVWAYQRAASLHISGTYPQQHMIEGEDERALACRYLSTCAAVEDPARLLPLLSAPGCAAILLVVSQDFANGEPELVLEAARRLQSCRDDMLAANVVGRIPG